MVGSAIVRKLKAMGCETVITRSSQELDLSNQAAVINFFKAEKIDYVILAAAIWQVLSVYCFWVVLVYTLATQNNQ